MKVEMVKERDRHTKECYLSVSSLDLAITHLWYHILAEVGSPDPVHCYLLGSVSLSTSKHFTLFHVVKNLIFESHDLHEEVSY